MNRFSKALASMKDKAEVGVKELRELLDLADQLGIRFKMKVTSEKFAEITLDGGVTAFDEKVDVGSATLTVRLFH